MSQEVCTPVVKQRDSSLGLFRIITMLMIVIHHYVMNSGVIQAIYAQECLTLNSYALLVLGGFGKIGINCFMLITGYFMCTKDVSYIKLFKILFMLEFYKLIIYFTFIFTGYEVFTLKGCIKTLMPLLSIQYGFINTFIVFFLFIPFLNILIRGMTQKQHLHLCLLSVGIYSFWPSLFIPQVTLGYVGWFMILYFVASYLRLYPLPWFSSRKIWGWFSLGALMTCIASILVCTLSGRLGSFAFVANSNKILALGSSICFFMFFKNLKLTYSKTINQVATACLGVLLIHANSDTMRQWLWRDTANNVGWLESPYCLLHCLGVCLLVYIVCTLIELCRIRFIETPLFAVCFKK